MLKDMFCSSCCFHPCRPLWCDVLLFHDLHEASGAQGCLEVTKGHTTHGAGRWLHIYHEAQYNTNNNSNSRSSNNNRSSNRSLKHNSSNKVKRQQQWPEQQQEQWQKRLAVQHDSYTCLHQILVCHTPRNYLLSHFSYSIVLKIYTMAVLKHCKVPSSLVCTCLEMLCWSRVLHLMIVLP